MRIRSIVLAVVVAVLASALSGAGQQSVTWPNLVNTGNAFVTAAGGGSRVVRTTQGGGAPPDNLPETSST